MHLYVSNRFVKSQFPMARTDSGIESNNLGSILPTPLWTTEKCWNAWFGAKGITYFHQQNTAHPNLWTKEEFTHHTSLILHTWCWVPNKHHKYSGEKAAIQNCVQNADFVSPIINFTNILKAAFLPISFCQESTSLNCQDREALKKVVH